MEAERVDALAAALDAAGEAHHEARGGPDHDWAVWYARWLDGRLEPILGWRPPVDRVAGWLRDADRRHRQDAADRPWATVYAELILEWGPREEAEER